jgi:hypothetical protein
VASLIDWERLNSKQWQVRELPPQLDLGPEDPNLAG